MSLGGVLVPILARWRGDAGLSLEQLHHKVSRWSRDFYFLKCDSLKSKVWYEGMSLLNSKFRECHDFLGGVEDNFHNLHRHKSAESTRWRGVILFTKYSQLNFRPLLISKPVSFS